MGRHGVVYYVFLFHCCLDSGYFFLCCLIRPGELVFWSWDFGARVEGFLVGAFFCRMFVKSGKECMFNCYYITEIGRASCRERV